MLILRQLQNLVLIIQFEIVAALDELDALSLDLVNYVLTSLGADAGLSIQQLAFFPKYLYDSEQILP